MSAPPPVQAIVFDAYGTLFDVYSIAAACDRCFPGRGAELSRLWRSKQLEYTWLRSLMQRYEDFEAITDAALRYSCRATGLNLSAESRTLLMEQYRHLSVHSEVPAALKRLTDRKLAILSNGSPAMLQAVVANAGIASAFHAVLSVDALRIYKPHPSVYQLAVDTLGVPAERIAFISSNFWDVSGATAFGFRTYWINRAQTTADELGQSPAGVLASLDELPAALA